MHTQSDGQSLDAAYVQTLYGSTLRTGSQVSCVHAYDFIYVIAIDRVYFFSRNLPQSNKKRKLSSDNPSTMATGFDANDISASTPIHVSHVLQGEIARLDQKFKLSLDQSVHSNDSTGIIKLICCLDDTKLPCVPPISVLLPEMYPMVAPTFKLAEHEYNATEFLSRVQSALVSRIAKLPRIHSLSQLLDTWEMSVRQACAPKSSTSPQPSLVSTRLGL